MLIHVFFSRDASIQMTKEISEKAPETEGIRLQTSFEKETPVHEELESINTPPSGCILAPNLEEVVQLHQKSKKTAHQ